MSAQDIRFMNMALSLGRRGQGNTWPNPAVGCVLVRDGHVLARGWTQPGGRPHAEAHAISQCSDTAGATAYVTLEPCAHQGRADPCCAALVNAGITRCVVAMVDPDPRTKGKGIAALQAAGIEVLTDVCAQSAQEDHKGFVMRLMESRPRLTLKLATTLDGRIATASGDSQWITGPKARRQVHRDRLAHDAIMVGGGTARADDPSLTVRGMGQLAQPVRIIASSKLNFRGTALFSATGPVWCLHGAHADPSDRDRIASMGAELIEIPGASHLLDPAAILSVLAGKGLTSIYCEGGGTLAASLLQAGLVDDLLIYTAGKFIGAEGQPAIGALGLGKLIEAQDFTLVDHRAIDGVIRSHWTLTP